LLSFLSKVPFFLMVLVGLSTHSYFRFSWCCLGPLPLRWRFRESSRGHRRPLDTRKSESRCWDVDAARITGCCYEIAPNLTMLLGCPWPAETRPSVQISDMCFKADWLTPSILCWSSSTELMNFPSPLMLALEERCRKASSRLSCSDHAFRVNHDPNRWVVGGYLAFASRAPTSRKASSLSSSRRRHQKVIRIRLRISELWSRRSLLLLFKFKMPAITNTAIRCAVNPE
jgi:hypothetical protein